MNKVLKIILILLGSFLVILGIIWLIGRNNALKKGQEPLTFREFLGLGTKKNNATTVPDENSSTFTNGGTTGAGGDGGADGTNGGNTGGSGDINPNGGGNISQFTNGGTSIDNGNFNTGGNGSLNGGTGSDNIDGSGNPNGTGGDGNDISVGSPGNSDNGSQPVCSDEDLNIEFTDAQREQLNILQSRFYALAQTLHSDTDVATEVSNHDAFTLKADNDLALYAYCEAKIPSVNALADARLKLHTATPFWQSYGNNPALASFISAKTGVAIPADDPVKDAFSYTSLTGIVDLNHLEDIHDSNDKNPEANGVKGPYGLLTLSNPTLVTLSGSAVGDDYQLLIPVVEKALRLNLW